MKTIGQIILDECGNRMCDHLVKVGLRCSIDATQTHAGRTRLGKRWRKQLINDYTTLSIILNIGRKAP